MCADNAQYLPAFLEKTELIVVVTSNYNPLLYCDDKIDNSSIFISSEGDKDKKKKKTEKN